MDDRIPLTPHQADIWVASQLQPLSPQFSSCGFEEISGPLDIDLLRACLRRAIGRNDALRLRFDEIGGRPVQWAHDGAPQIPVVDLSGEPDPPAAARAHIRASFERPFEPRGARMFDAGVLRCGDATSYAYLTAHHLITDGWGGRLVMRQVWQDYRHTLRHGSPPDLPAPSYLEHAAEQSGYPGSARHAADVAYHGAALSGVAPVLFGRAPATAGPRTGRHTFTIPERLVGRLRGRQGTPFALFAAALGGYLCRVHRAEEVVLGVPVLNRPDHRQRRTVGHFANELPLRVRAGGRRSLPEVVADLRRCLDSLRGHEGLPAGELPRLPALAGAAIRQLHDVTLTWMRWPGTSTVAGLRRRASVRTHAHDRDALSVLVNEFAGGGPLVVEVSYARDVFDENFPVEAFGGHLVRLLAGALDAGDRPLSTVDMLSPAERGHLVHGLNPAPSAFPDDLTVHGLIERQVSAAPDRVALLGDPAAGAERLTYAQLDARANRLARALRGDGVGPDDRVAVLTGRGTGLLVAVLAVLKAGGAYVPIDPDHPAERVRFLLADSGAKVALVDGGTAGLLDGGTAGLLDAGVPAPHGAGAGPGPTANGHTGTGSGLDDGGGRGRGGGAAPGRGRVHGVPARRVDAVPRLPDGPLEPVSGPDNLAYVIYTSGSTGQPKGVAVEHRSVVNRLTWMQRRYPLGAPDVLLQKTPVGFDVSVWELFWWAIAGARLALAPPGAARDPRRLLHAVAHHGVTVLHFVPSMFGPFLDLLESAAALRARVASLRFIFCSGEELPRARVDQFNRLVAGLPAAPALVNLYGPTEATVDVSWFECPTDPDRPVTRVPIGRPIDNVRLYVLDADGQPQPPGAPGELCVAGVAVARGYLGRPELTAQRFTDDPYHPGQRLYRTGDLARWLADGCLEYLGRLDGQVKVRGNRVELGEVRHRLATFPAVRDAVVIDRRSDARGVFLVGYYVADGELDPLELRAHLAATLPDFMIPSFFVRIPAVPLSLHGKLNLRALPAPGAGPTGPGGATGPSGPTGPSGQPAIAGAPGDPGAPGAAPRDPAERALLDIWSRELGVAPIGVHDNYFAIGGDSILALRIRAAAERQGLHFDLSDLVAHPTVAALAARLGTGPAAGPPVQPSPFELVAYVDRARLAWAQDAYPASQMALGLLYHSREHEVSASYHDVFRYSLRIPWDEKAMRGAHARLVARHPALRSGFDLSGCSEPVQIVHHRVAGGLEIVDLREVGEETAAGQIDAHMRQRRYHRYEFDRPPLHLMRVHLLPHRVELVFSFHHVILDGWSVAALIRDLLQDYLHLAGRDIAAVAEDPPPSAAGFVAAQRSALACPAHRRFWRERLAGAEATRIDGMRQYSRPGDGQGIVRTVEVPGELHARVRAFAREHAVPVKSVLLAAHCLTLGLFADCSDVTTGLVTHCRPEVAGAERVAGLFLNTLPLRVRLPRDSWLSVVWEVYRQERECHPYRHYPLAAIGRDLDGGPVLETVFNYVHLHVLRQVLEVPGVALLDLVTWEQTNFGYLLNVFVSPAGDRMVLRVDTDGRTFTGAQTDLVVATYLRVLRRVLADPTGAVDFGFLAEPVHRFVPARGPASTVVGRLERHIAATPHAPAVAFDGRGWSYAEFGRITAGIARRLIRLGIRPGDRVGVALDRSPELIAVIYGIARAGAACVPLDVGYPRERIAAMIEQAGPARVVTDRRHAHLVGDPELALLIPDAPAAGTASTPHAPAAWKAGAAGAPPLPAIDPSSLLYVLFTSGSTGRPKGVAMSHRALDNYQIWQVGAASGAAGGVTLQFAPLSFDVAFQEIYTTISGGGTLQLIGDEQRRDMPALLRLLDSAGVERVFLPYVALQQLAEASAALGLVPRRLRVVISSGEQLRVTAEIRRFMAALPAGAVLENQYGPTETHLVTAHLMSGDPALLPSLPPIGAVTDGVECHLLDRRLRPVARGVAGELYFGGVQLADGYLGQPALTGQRFVPNPFGPPGSRLYRTGDIARLMPDGNLMWIARADTQTKIRGFRVEPLEVEVAIMRLAEGLAGLSEAAVVARRREGTDSFLAAFLVGDEHTVDLGRLRRQLRAELPEYLVPSYFGWLPRMPLTPSGKRDDAALRRLPLAAGAARAATAPRDGYEKSLVELFADLLQVPSIGVDDNFFEAGGTSLTAMRLVVTVEKRYGVGLPLSSFVTAPTAAGLAEVLRAGQARFVFDPVVPIRAEGSRPPLFLVHPIGGNVLCYLRLARHLPADQPVYALQAPGGEVGTEPVASVAELARDHLLAIRRVRPTGPYRLGGWSFGGMVAFEMARQLRAAGDRADRLILIDAIVRRPGDHASVPDRTLLEWFYWELLLLERSGHCPVERLPAHITTPGQVLDYITDRATETGVLRPGTSRAAVGRLFAVFRAHWQAIVEYRPEVSDVGLTLLRAAQPLPRVLVPMHTAAGGTMHADPHNGWAALTTGGIDTVPIPGDHLVLMEEPYVVEVARAIADRLTGAPR